MYTRVEYTVPDKVCLYCARIAGGFSHARVQRRSLCCREFSFALRSTKNRHRDARCVRKPSKDSTAPRESRPRHLTNSGRQVFAYLDITRTDYEGNGGHYRCCQHQSRGFTNASMMSSSGEPGSTWWLYLQTRGH